VASTMTTLTTSTSGQRGGHNSRKSTFRTTKPTERGPRHHAIVRHSQTASQRRHVPLALAEPAESPRRE
jgi:hypothetical protein